MLTLLGLTAWLSRPAPAHRTRSGIPLPPLLHATIPDEALRGKRLYVVGDVHGCYTELRSLLAAICADDDESVVVVLAGDLVNKGPRSVDVIRLARAYGTRCYAVRGNHDEAGLREWFRLRADAGYLLSPKYAWVSEMTEADADYLLALPYTLSVPSRGTLIVHGGLIPRRPLADQSPADMTTMRNLIVRDHFGHAFAPTEHIERGVPWASLWPGPEHVLFGHDARRRLQTYAHATGLDTGCVYGGQLTALLLREDGGREYVQVPSRTATAVKNCKHKTLPDAHC
ncbi:PREDICTED: serine/threonine-protein phosphatase 1-like [Priapulus caudatus]|uniref:Serine/threonine-protein phosphatase 1-like n=1 Tax=Priapulus caudatus TaxID=37621 RepID=A0ABM1ENU4_PRICU|nr:PREDICTED: serine/threonine-protein phosphatase 1-like [Priapulus caudatus]